MSTHPPRAHGNKSSAIFGLIGLAIACAVCISSFWRMNDDVHDSLVLTSYVAELPPGRQLSFGYGGELAQEKIDIPLQGREMSNISFTISLSNSGELAITGQDDQIRYKGKWYEKGGKDAVRIFNGDTVQSKGWLGGATFKIRLESASNTLNLDLATPIYREIKNKDQAVRVVFGPRHDPVPAPVDEIYIRTTSEQAGKTQSYLAQIQDDALLIGEELDLGTVNSPADTKSLPVEPPTSGSNTQSPATTSSIELKPGQPRRFGNVELTFNHYGENRVLLFGIKLALAMIILGLAFWLGPKANWPSGILIFGCATILISVGLSLSARDFFFAPHEGRFLKYVSVLFWSALVLYCLRFPVNPSDTGMQKSDLLRISGSLMCFIVAYDLLDPRFDQTQWSFWPGLGKIGWVILCFISLLLIISFFYLLLYALLERLTKYPLDTKSFWLTVLVATAPFWITALTLVIGGREALTIAVIGRIHLPTLLLPFIIVCIALLVSAANSDPSSRAGILLVTILVIGGGIAVYRWRSADNGGTLILGVGMLSAFWLASGKKWGVPLLLTGLALSAGLFLGLHQAERFDLAWGGEEGQVLYFDKAKNLRLARDLARAGGKMGMGFDLPIPSGLRGNLHNDLVAAYISGVFGWVFLALVILAFGIFFHQLWGGLASIVSQQMINPTTPPQSGVNIRTILVTIAGSAIITFAVQGVWVVTASLQPLLPLTGLDLQPISASGSSALSFMLILLGSVAIAHTADQNLP